MKKILSLVMALMLLAMCTAMAETAETTVEMQRLTSPDGTYSYEVPAEYFTLSAELFKTIFAQEATQELLAQMMGLEDASQLAAYFELLEQINMMVVYSGDMGANLNAQVAESPLTMDQIVLFKEAMDAAMVEQYKTLGVAEEDVKLLEIMEIGGRRWYGMQVRMMGVDVLCMITVENNMQYTFTFTGVDGEVARHVLETFTVTPAAE